VVANLGDASMACGPVWEGLNFAAMDQFTKLWEGDMNGGLPIIINIMDNMYGMGGQTFGETMGYHSLPVSEPALMPIKCMPNVWMGIIRLPLLMLTNVNVKSLKIKKGRYCLIL